MRTRAFGPLPANVRKDFAPWSRLMYHFLQIITDAYFMPQYIYKGQVLPQRAPMSFQSPEMKVNHPGRAPIVFSINITDSNLSVRLTTDDTDIFTIKNFLYDFISAQIAVLGFTHGYVYDLDISEVVTADGVSHTKFGIEMPCIASIQEERDLSLSPDILAKLSTLLNHSQFIRRFLTDFTLAMKHAGDTGFYCYRALESLRQHCAASAGLDLANEKKNIQWEKFRNIANACREELDPIRDAAEGVRHGGAEDISSEQRQALLVGTWKIAERYLKSVAQNNA